MLSLLWLVAGCRRQQNQESCYLCASPSASLIFSSHYEPKRWGWGGVSSENGTRARARGCEPGSRPRDLEAFPCACAYLRFQPFPHFLGSDPCARPTGCSQLRTRASSFLHSPPTAPEAARGATWVRLSLAGVATFLPRLWSFDKITMTCSKVL